MVVDQAKKLIKPDEKDVAVITVSHGDGYSCYLLPTLSGCVRYFLFSSTTFTTIPIFKFDLSRLHTCLMRTHSCEHFWNHMHQRVANEINKALPNVASDNTWCFVQTLRRPMVQERLLTAIRAAAQDRKRKKVVILSCFNGTGGAMFLKRLQERYLGDKPLLDDPSTSGL